MYEAFEVFTKSIELNAFTCKLHCRAETFRISHIFNKHKHI